MKLFALASFAAAQTTEYTTTTDRTTLTPYGWTTDCPPWWCPERTTVEITTEIPALFDDCGGTITGYENFASPHAGDNVHYPNNARCVWNIELGDDVVGFNIVTKLFEVEDRYDCAFDYVKLVANGREENYCGARGRQDANDTDKEKEAGKYNPDLVNPIDTGFPPSKFIAGGSALVSFYSDDTVRDLGFEFVIVKMTRFQIINHHVERLTESVSDQKWGSRFAGRMQKSLDRLAEADTGVSCYGDNFPEETADEGDEITVFDADDMCKLNGQVNAAINSYARNNACEGRGKVYRQIIRSARKVKKFFNDKNDC